MKNRIPIPIAAIAVFLLILLANHTNGQITLATSAFSGNMAVSCPGTSGNQITLTITNSSGAAIPAPLYLKTDLGVDMVGGIVDHGPFLTPTVQAPTSALTVAWTTYQGTAALGITSALPTGVSTIMFQVGLDCDFSFVNSNTADQGPDNQFINSFKLFDNGGNQLASVNSTSFTITGPLLLITAMPPAQVVPLGATEIHRQVNISGAGGPAPNNGIIIFEDHHAFSDGDPDALEVTGIRYSHMGNWVVIPREVSPGSAPGRDRFRINGNSPDPGVQAFYQAVLAGPVAFEEVIAVGGLCGTTVPADDIRSELRIGWSCESSSDAELCDHASRLNVMLTRDTSKPCMRMEHLTTDLPACYYDGSGYGTVTVRIRNTGVLSGTVRRIRLAFAGITTSQVGPQTGVASRMVLNAQAPLEISQEYASVGGSPNWATPAHVINAPSTDPSGTVIFTEATACGSQDELLNIYNDGDMYIPELAPGRSVEVRFRIEICPLWASTGPWDCPSNPDYALLPMGGGVGFDYACNRLTSEQVRAGATAPNGCVLDPFYTRAPRLQLSRTQYIGSTHNLMGACFLGESASQTEWDVRFKLRDAVSLWPRPSDVPTTREKIALEIELEPYLYLRPEDLNGDHPLTITTSNQEVFSTDPATPITHRLTIVDPSSTNGLVNFCSDLDCPDASGFNGWSGNQRVLLLVEGFNSGETAWVTQPNARQRLMTRFQNAVIKLPLRMHCPDEAGDEPGADCAQYVPGCAYAANDAPSAAPKKLRIRLLQIPDVDADCGSGTGCGAAMIPLSCHVQTLNIQCPGCTRLGIHSENFSIDRWSYGYVDGRSDVANTTGADDGFADTGADTDNNGIFDPGLDQITYEEVMNGEHPDVDRHKAMYGDLLMARHNTTIKMNCDGYGPCVSGQPAVDLTHMYLQTDFVAPDICPAGIVDLVDLVMTFTDPNGPDFTVTIDGALDSDTDGIPDVLDPDQNVGGPIVATTPTSHMFDLSPSILTGRTFVSMSNPSLYDATFSFNDHHDMVIDIATRYRVKCNVGLTTEPVTVNNQIFLATHQQTTGLANINTTGFPDPSFDFLTVDCNDPGIDCDAYQYYCTKKGGGFSLSGYEFSVNVNAGSTTQQGTCSYGPNYTYRFIMERPGPLYEPGVPTNAFPFEFRNWAHLLSASSWFNALDPGHWGNGRFELTEFTHGGIRAGHQFGDRSIILTPGNGFTYEPQATGQPQLLSIPPQALNYSSGTMPTGTEVDQPTDLLLLPDDGFGIKIRPQYDANCTTPSGPLVVATGQVIHRYEYIHGRDFDFAWSDAGPLAPTSLGEGNAYVSYHKPILSLPVHQTIPSTEECWNDLVIGHTSSPGVGHSRFSSLWVAFDEAPGTPLADGLDLTSLSYRLDNGAYQLLTSDVQSSDKYIIPGAITSANVVRIKVCANVPCLIPLDQDHDQGTSPGDAPNGDAQADMYTGWACDVQPGDLASSCNARGILRYVPSTPLLQIPEVLVEQVDCERYRVTMELASVGTGAVQNIEIGADVAMSPGPGWSYVAGSAALLNSSHVVIGQAGIGLVDPISASDGCTGGTGSMKWDLSTCNGCTGELSDFISDGLCPTGSPCAIAYVSFDVERAEAACPAMMEPVNVWARSAECGIQCQIADVSVAASILPDENIIVSLDAPDILDCGTGSLITMIIQNPGPMPLDNVSVSLDLPAALIADSPLAGCADAVQVTSGDVQWTFEELLPAVPCTLTVGVFAQPCVTDIHAITVNASLQCCSLTLGTQSDSLSVEGGDSCSLSLNTSSTPSTCGGPWQVLCGAFAASNGQSVVIDGVYYQFVNGGGAFIQYDEGVWTLTGELEGVFDPSLGYWFQLYLDNEQDYNAWTADGGAADVTSPFDPTTWTFYEVSDVPTWESLLVGVGGNFGNVYDLEAQGAYGFQFGDGANTNNGGSGASLRFDGIRRGGGTNLSGKFLANMNCDFSAFDFSPCSGSIGGTITGGTAPYSLTITGPNYTHTINSTTGTFLFDGLCNNIGYAAYTIEVTDVNDCVEVLTGIFLDNGLEPLSAEIDFTPNACEEDNGCAAAVNVSGGLAPYEAHWYWQGVVDGQEPITAPDTVLCGLATDEENWVVITDSNGCYITYKYFILETPNSTPQFEYNTTPACGATGTVALDLFFDTSAPFTIAWTGPGGFTSDELSLSGLVAGAYEVTVWSFDEGCAWTVPVVVPEDCPCEEFSTLQLSTDANGAHTSWEVLNSTTLQVVCSGSGYPSNTDGIIDQCCLPDGCYTLRVLDSAGDGMSGSYLLRGPSGARIIHNADGFPGALAQHADVFCLPTGPVGPLASRCDLLTWTTAGTMICAPIPEVSALFVPGAANNQQPSNTGYEFWFFNPDGGYSKRIFNSHQVSNGYPQTETKACHLRLTHTAFNADPLPVGTLLNVRMRARVNGVNTGWGPACRFQLGGDPAACWPTQLVDISTMANHSCGVTRIFGSTATDQRLQAYQLQGAIWYRYELRKLPNGTPFTILRSSGSSTSNSYLPPTWTTSVAPLPNNGDVYSIRVQSRKPINGVQTWCSYGDACTVTFVTSSGMAPLGSGEGAFTNGQALLWPNPNATGVVMLQLSDLSPELHHVGWNVYDAQGKKVMDEQLPIADGYLRSEITLPAGTRPGLYVVRIMAGTRQFVEHLVIQ